MNYNKLNNALGWICFIIATATYVLTLEPTASFWDAGEFIAASYKMQIVHQPGAPLFLMLQNIFSNFAFGNTERLAYWMNVGSAVSSALTILFLFWTITALARKILVKDNTPIDQATIIKIMGAGVVGALAYTFSDTFWFSAVESEVYAMASLCTAIVFWAILKWDAHADEPGADRWLILIAYVMGLSIGVHLLNLLTIPALALVIYFRKTKTPTSKGAISAMLIGCVVLGLILWGIIQYLIKAAAYFDYFFVNSLGTGFGVGVLTFVILLVGGIVYGIVYSIKKNKPRLNLAFLCVAFIIIGYSSFSMILIRAKADPTLNNSDPDNAFSFLSYLNREQYGEDPLLIGPYFDSQLIDINIGGNTYRKGDTKYEVSGQKFDYVYDRETFFPRIYSRQDSHVQFYRDWLNLGPNEQPSFGDNLSFFFNYQIGHMYTRYFMWNFVGRQNHEQGHGSYIDGNWISGIKFIDQIRLGGQNDLPEAELSNPSRNTFFFLPLILGLIGALWQFKRNPKDAGIVALLFFFTGLAIVLYLNQNPLQPRERDYAYAGSFYAFAIWIGLGVIGISDFLQKKVNAKTAGLLATGIGLLIAPVLMAKEGWDDHNRSTKWTARDLAINYLESCAPNAILFTYGDNDTYPLWYVQEVENIRPDVRVVNLSLLTADWYIRQMKNPVNESAALPITMQNNQFVQGNRDYLRFQDYKIEGNVALKDILALLLSDSNDDKFQYPDGTRENFLPTKNFAMSINKDDVLRNNVVPAEWQDRIADHMVWTYNKGAVSKGDLAMFDILVHNNWERPIYFAVTVPTDNFIGLDNYLYTEGFAYRLMPIKQENSDPETMVDKVNPFAMYTNTLDKFVWGNIKDAKYLDHESYGMINVIINNFTTLANSLLAQGKTEEARTVMNRAYDVIPERIYTQRQALQRYLMGELLYKIGEPEKASKIFSANLNYISEYLKYYFAIAQTKNNLERENTQLGMYTLHGMQEVSKEFNQTELNDEIQKVFSNLEKRYMETFQQ